MSNWVVVGAGVTGLALALAGQDAGHSVVLLERGDRLGGLTSTITLHGDGEPVEVDRFYHVILESDSAVLELLDHLDMRDAVRWTSAPAAVVADATSHPATSLLDMARLPALALRHRILIAWSITLSLLLPSVVSKRITAKRWLIATGGHRAYRSFWAPILQAKLGNQADRVAARFLVSTFRRLVHARLSGAGDRFGVMAGGYSKVFERAMGEFTAAGGQVRTNVRVTRITSVGAADPQGRVLVELADGNQLHCDEIFVTAHGAEASAMVPQLTGEEHAALTSAPYLGVLCTVLLLRRPPNDSYITYLVDELDLTGVIGMHALLPPDQTAGGSLVYLPRYCASDDPWFESSDEQVRDRMLDQLAECFPDFEPEVLDWAVSRARRVVPLPLPNAAEPLPSLTSVPGVHVVSTAQNTSGTLNVETSLRQAAAAITALITE